MQNPALIPIDHIIKVLDEEFEIFDYIGQDISFIKRIHDYFDTNTILKFEKGFIENCNGIMLRGSDSISTIYGSAFLSNDTMLELVNTKRANSLLIVHHPLDIESGINTVVNIGYKAVSKELLYSYIADGGSIYCLHLPLDANKYDVNTHISLVRGFSFTYKDIFPLTNYRNHEMGFVLDVEPMMCVDLFYKIVRICPKAIKYGAPLLETKQIKRVGIMAGMISSIEQLAQIELCCDICVCGDLFIRDNSRRYIDMEKAIAQSSIPYICLSHNISESQVFMYGLFPLLKSFFPSLLFCEVQNSQFR